MGRNKKIAQIISDDNRNTITYTTSEVTIKNEEGMYTLGVGDYKNVIYNGENKRVRILGFNHDSLVTEKTDEEGNIVQVSQYGEGTTNTYAGISFQFIDSLFADDMYRAWPPNFKEGWGKIQLRNTLNNTTINAMSNKSDIKQVQKQYIVAYDTQNLRISNDYLWLLSCAETWDNGYNGPNTRGLADNVDGMQYQYYKDTIGSTLYSDECEKLKYQGSKLYSRFGHVWLRTPMKKDDARNCIIGEDGDCGIMNLGFPYNRDYTCEVVPGFSI